MRITFKKLFLCAAILPVLSACNDNDKNKDPAGNSPAPKSDAFAVVATLPADYTTSAMSFISVKQPRTIKNDVLPSNTSDVTVVSDGAEFYRIEKNNADNITKFSAADPTKPIWQYKTMSDSELASSNPYDIVVASDNKAYIIRYGSKSIWVVNPSATQEKDFKIGEIDLSAYDTADGIPNMAQGIIIGSKLFVITQGFDQNWLAQQAYLVVIDLNTDTEVSTGTSSDPNIKAIPLPVRNPQKIDYSMATGKLYIQAIGRFFQGEFDGGIISVDPNSYATSMIVDDGDSQSHAYGNLADLAIVNAEKGYFVGYDAWQDTSLYSFNLNTGEVNPTPVAGLAHNDIADITIAPDGKLWVASRTDFGIYVIDPTTDTAENQIISTGTLAPDTIVFVEP